MPLINSQVSCGVQQFFGLHRTPENILYHIYNRKRNYLEDGDDDFSVNIYDRGYGFILWSDSGDKGQKLADYITEHKLGEITETGTTTNPNSHNEIKVWVWAVDNEALNTWFAQHSS